MSVPDWLIDGVRRGVPDYLEVYDATLAAVVRERDRVRDSGVGGLELRDAELRVLQVRAAAAHDLSGRPVTLRKAQESAGKAPVSLDA